MRDAATLTRPSYLDIDMADLLSGQRYAEFAYAWRLLHASRAGLQATSDQTVKQPVVWEAWREAGQEEGTRVRNGLRLGVTQALLTFGNGFLQHPANDALRLALQNGELKKEDYFAQLLRLIYRLIFVFSIEERGLLKDANGQTNAAYTQGYALARLRDMALRRRARNRFDDLWQSMRIVFKGLNLGEPRLGLPALGGLFNTSQCPALDGAELSNAHLLATMQSMRWAAQAGGSLAPIDYRNMGVEELGSVYESLLELVPEVDLPARSFGFVGLTSEGSTAGNERKLTGSYYTPDSLVQELIQSALVSLTSGLQPNPTTRWRPCCPSRCATLPAAVATFCWPPPASWPSAWQPCALMTAWSHHPPTAMRCAKSLPAASTAWTATPWPSSWPALRCGWKALKRAGRSHSWTTTCKWATPCWV